MKILYLLSRIEKSGVTLHALDLAKGLVDQGHELIIITGGITDKNNSYLVDILNDFERLGNEVKVFKTPKGNIVNRAVTSFFSILQILRWIQNAKADVIHSQSPYMTFLPWLLRKKYVTTVHNVQLIKNIKYKNPTKLIAISRESKDYAIEELGASRETIDIVCHGVSKRYADVVSNDEKNLLRTKYEIPENHIIIGYVGRITREKGLDILINAIEEYLSDNQAEKIHLIFLGDYWTSADQRWLNEIIAESEIKEQISIVPFQDPKPFYQIFDIFVLPSYSEAFGLVSIEAMMSDCCTIRTDTNGALDQIVHGKDGFIFETGNSHELAQILGQIIQDSSFRATVAKNGKIKTLKNFTIEAMTSKTVETYQKIM